MNDRPAGLRSRIEQFLAAHNTLTLATVSPDGTPAAAAVFYAHDVKLNLYFLSAAGTVHSENLAHNPACAGAIQEEGQDWREIHGLQLRGSAEPARGNEVGRAAALYGRRYAFVAGLLAGSEGPQVLAGPLARARFYILRPAWLRLIDNRVRFGHKEELVLAAEEAQ